MQVGGYRFGRMEVDGVVWREDLWICAGQSGPWRRREGHRLHPEDLRELLPLSPEVILVGTGAWGRLEVPKETRDFLGQRGVELLALPTGEAVARYNELAPKKRVAALFHLTC